MNFEKRLKAKNLKVTPQRISILREIESNGHISIEDIYDKIKWIYPSTSLATIYKNVAIMCETDILSEVKTPGMKQKYEINSTKHIHVTCQKCGKLEDLHVDYSMLQESCKNLSGYDINTFSAVFMGLCPSCKDK